MPQYILDQHAREKRMVNIIVTQPRKIAASSLAKRVCQERDWRLGGLVGYQVGLDKENKSPDTRLLYVTTGVLKKQIIERKHLNNWSHIILDEVHEREEDMDLVMLLCKKLLATNSSGTKLVLMSATLNEEKLKKYFSIPAEDSGLMEAPSLQISPRQSQGRSLSNVVSTVFYDQLLSQFGMRDKSNFLMSRPTFHQNCLELTKQLIEHLDSVEDKEGKGRGGVLVFLPGIHEMKALRDHLMEGRDDDDAEETTKWECLPLHSRIPWEEQKTVFVPVPANTRKIILSTNIAESSITVPDIKYVVDFGLTKNIEVDRETQYPMLVLAWASKNQLVQRRGRAGRVGGDGRVFVLLPESLAQRLPQEHVPEIQRIPLTKLVLDVKLLEMGSPQDLLSHAMDPPKCENLLKTILSLKELRALHNTTRGEMVKEDGDLTVMGEVLARLPVDVKLGKLIVLGHIFGVLEEAIIVASGLNGKSIFSAPFDKRVQTYKNKLYWADRTFNDCFAILNAYQTWQEKIYSGAFSHRDGYKAETKFFQIYFLQKNQMLEMKLLIEEIKTSLKGMNIEPLVYSEAVKWEGEKKDVILQIVMFGAFYPNFFTKQSSAEVSLNAEKLLNGRDPWNTVYLQGMKDSQSKFGELYTRQLTGLFRECTSEAEKIHVSFEGRKIFVEFDQCGGNQDRRVVDRNYNRSSEGNLTGNILHQVFIALKLKQSGERMELDLYPDEVAETKFTEWQESQETNKNLVTVDQVKPPLIGTNGITIKGIAHISSPSLFWVYYGPNVLQEVKTIKRIISEVQEDCPFVSAGDVKVGGVFLAKSEGDYLRARVVSSRGSGAFTVFYIDQGQTSVVPGAALKSLPDRVIRDFPQLVSIPGLALECCLAGLQPSTLSSSRNLWDQQVSTEFSHLLSARDGREIEGEIFSVTQSVADPSIFVVNLESMKTKIQGAEVDIKHFLIEENLADYVTESFKSQNDHRLRMRFDAFSAEMKEYLRETYFSSKVSRCDVKTLKEDPRQLARRIRLQGPFSPLQHQLVCQFKLGTCRMTSIDPDSVNSVLLDGNPSNREGQWLAAAHVVLSSDGDSQLARNTFWLPDKPGLGPLLSMLFAPQVEMRFSEDSRKKTNRVTGFIAGLGPKLKEEEGGNHLAVKKRSSGLYPEHDMEIKFNVNVDNQDIVEVNNMRYWLNTMMMKTREGVMVMTQPKALHKAQEGIKKSLEKLLGRERAVVDKVGVSPTQEFR